jgi:hypothetical protein
MACAIENERSCAIPDGWGFNKKACSARPSGSTTISSITPVYAVPVRVTKTLLWIGAVAETVFVACKSR